ncbi:ATP-binding protein [Chloroflexus aggregans]|uniref:Transcriptional regulator n=1 Tax=Chloroflexus aggregans (strain MD-66 / DSM 9485) TaxID=326427 RepID=B8GCX8_CHLAD|nr:ATP-binding protein [Chloroflexus aggregans]ACL23178.1 putative transcriptional regulator [Chloroflexus aggregans DSM 9485]
MESSPIAALPGQAPGPRLAFAGDRQRPDEIAESLAALANAHGGALVISGGRGSQLAPLRDPAAAIELALSAALACTPPLIIPLPQVVVYHDMPVVVVEVPAGLPYVYSINGRYLRREGDSNQPLSPAALHRLFSERAELGWERQVPLGASFAELDPDLITAYARRVGPPAGDDPMTLLTRRGCLIDNRPTNAGLLLFGRDVAVRFPQAEITLVRYRGREPDDVFERADICAPLPDAIRRAERWLNDHMRKGSRMIGLEREDWTQFPPAAVREALVNAVAHRDYAARGEGIRITLFSNRLEVYSPGRLPGHVTLDNIRAERFSRNPAIVQVLADLGLVERLGYGIDRMLRHLAAAGLPPATFHETAAGFLVILPGHPFAEELPGGIDTTAWRRMGLNDRQISALLFVVEQQRITNRDLQEMHPDVSPETIRRDLSDLVARGLLLKVGDKRATYYILK